MTKQEFRQLADLIVKLNCTYPYSGDIVSFVEHWIEKIVKQQPTFNKLKWDRYISTEISKLMVRSKLKETNLCSSCLGKGYFEQSHDGMGRQLTCDDCSGTGLQQEE